MFNGIKHLRHSVTVCTPTKELQASPSRGRRPRRRRKALNQGKDLFRGEPGVRPYDLGEIQTVFGLEVCKDVLAVLINQTDERCASPVWVASIHFSRRTRLRIGSSPTTFTSLAPLPSAVTVLRIV